MSMFTEFSSSAILSDCCQYRYRLEREVAESGKVFAYFGINPSTADATIDDQTVKKWKGFTLRNGGARFLVGNVFAYRATKVAELKSVGDPHGPENLRHILAIISEAEVLVPCWGNATKVPRSLRHCIGVLENRLFESGKPVLCFGHTTKGDPTHPQMLGYNTPLVPYRTTSDQEAGE